MQKLLFLNKTWPPWIFTSELVTMQDLKCVLVTLFEYVFILKQLVIKNISIINLI